MAYPTTSDLSALLVDTGVTTPANYDLAGALNSAIAEIESLTGRKFVGSTDQTRRYDPPQIIGTAQFVEIVDSNAVNEVRADYDGTNSTLLTEWRDYILHPQNTSNVYEAIEFLVPKYGRYSILVNADEGWDGVPADVTDAILKRAASDILEQVGGVSGLVSQEKLGDAQVTYAVANGQSTIDRYNTAFYAVVARYTRVPY